MKRKEYYLTLGVIIVVSLTIAVTNAYYYYMDWIYAIIIPTLGYMYIKYRISGPIQMFATKFNMLADYDLDLAQAEQLAQEGFDNAPTKGIKAMYQMYLGMAKYYNGKYDEAIRLFNSIEFAKLNTVYHVLVFSFTGYAAFELNDEETMDFSIERIKNVAPRLLKRYQGFAMSYLEILEAIRYIDTQLDQYKEVIDRHFTKEDGFISTKIVYQYRLAHYYKRIGDTLEMDKCLAFCIANGKDHHMAVRAKEMFQGSVDINDFIYKEEEVMEEVDNIDDSYLIESEDQQEEKEEE